MKLTKLLLVAALGLSAHSAFSHGAWLAQRLDAQTIVYGEGARDNGYDPEKITHAQAFDAQGNPVDVDMHKSEYNVSFDKESEFSSAAFVLTNGYYTKTEEKGYIKKPQNEVDSDLTIIKSLYSVKAGLGYTGKGDMPSLDKLSKLPLVIYPETQLEGIEPGQEVTVTVYHKGKPVAGAKVVHDYVTASKVHTVTDENGHATFKVRNNGLNVVKVSHKVDTKNCMKERAQYYSYSSTLSFAAKYPRKK